MVLFFLIFYSSLSLGIKDPTAPLMNKPNVNPVLKKKGKFSDRYKLQAIFISKDKKIVVINGEEYKQGDVLGGYLLKSIEKDHVLLFIKGKISSLWLYPADMRKGFGK